MKHLVVRFVFAVVIATSVSCEKETLMSCDEIYLEINDIDTLVAIEFERILSSETIGRDSALRKAKAKYRSRMNELEYQLETCN